MQYCVNETFFRVYFFFFHQLSPMTRTAVQRVKRYKSRAIKREREVLLDTDRAKFGGAKRIRDISFQVRGSTIDNRQ